MMPTYDTQPVAAPCEDTAQFFRSHMVTIDTSALMGENETMTSALERLPDILAADHRCRLFLLTPVLDELYKHASGAPSPARSKAVRGLAIVDRLVQAGMVVFDVPPVPTRERCRFFDAALLGVCQRYHSCARIGVITQDKNLAASLFRLNATLPSQDVIAVRRVDPRTGALSCFDRYKIDQLLHCKG